MSDEQSGPETPDTPNEPEAGGSPLEDVSGAVDRLNQFLRAIVVVDRHEIADVFGNVYTYRPVLSARRQLEAAVRFDDLISLKENAAVLTEAREIADQRGQFAGIMAFLRAVLASHEARSRFHQLVQCCHPLIIRRAQQAAVDVWHSDEQQRAEWQEVDGLTSPPHDVLDLFELDQLVQALLPFCARFASRISASLAALAGPMTTADDSPISSPPSLSRHSGS